MLRLFRLAAFGLMLIGIASAHAVEPQEAVTAFAYRQLGRALADMATELARAKQRVADLEAYARACGDKPGCFVPAH